MIQAYPDRLSVLPGQSLLLHVSCDGPSFRVGVYRQGASLAWVQDFTFATRQPRFQAQPFFDRPWGWDSYEVAIPASWASGVYACMLFERDADGTETTPDKGVATTYGRWGKALFVVRSPAPGTAATLVYKVPFATYHAYNHEGGGSLYTNTGDTVTMHRPGGGAGGEITPFVPELGEGDVDHYDGASSRQTFEHWDARFIRWLEGSGYRCDYVADADLDPAAGLGQGVAAVRAYGMLLVVGHDEYWSPGVRAGVEAFVAGGGNLAIFSGNTCWWRIHYDAAGTSFSCHKSEDTADPTSDHYYIAAAFDPGVRPENALTGVSYRNAGGWWKGPRQALGYTVQHAGSWPFEGSGLAEHVAFGAAGFLVGYECDGAETAGFDCATNAGVAVPTGADGTPASFQILGLACLQGWFDPHGQAKATMGMYSAVGTVFSAATADWARVLEAGDPHVATITRTVLDRLGGNPKGLGPLGTLPGSVAVDGLWSRDDANRHAIVLGGAGEIRDIAYHPSRGVTTTLVTTLAGATDVGAFYQADAGLRHVIVLAAGGGIHNVTFLGSGALAATAQIGTIPQAIAVAGFFSTDEGFCHAIVATATGDIHEIYFRDQSAPVDSVVAHLPGAIDVGAFYSDDERYRHAVVASSDGSIHEVFFQPDAGISVTQIASVPGVARISGYYATGDAFFSRRVLALTSAGALHDIRFSPGGMIVRSVVLNNPGVVDVGGFFTGDEGYRHGIVVNPAGLVQELYYKP